MEQSERPVCLEDAVDLHQVLHRDQRTVRVRVAVDAPRTATPRRLRRVARPPSECEQCQLAQLARRGVQPVCDLSVPQFRICHRHTSSSLRSRSSSSWFPVGSVIRWLLAALCVLALLPPRAMAAPTPTRSQPKWINPCGLNKQDVEQELEYQNESAASVTDLLQRIVTLSKNALDHAVQFRVAYVEETFQKDYEDHHRSWQIHHYDWLPNIPKQLGEKVQEEHLRAQSLEVALKDIYKYLQQYAVGLEQVVIDQKASGSSYKDKFDYDESLLRNVLCEVQVAMQEQGVVQHPDVSPDIMGPAFRDPTMNSTFRNVRDWIILRDYMNGLEYIIQTLEYFSKPQH
ncbi:uncharacterized protein LOC117641792 [Thrips palmi]|uniref:Uncharacterized protein LOC117641792 n=1 Tax=Thrips palmi TaxID=161013 RepID=A0A6P8YMR7_THRPL|nr:uncharacterized protein LOC117641792 [Thrips palmi]